MKIEVISLPALYPSLGADKCTLTCYVPDGVDAERGEVRRGLLVLPGGGYSYCSRREAEPIAVRFAAENYNCYVLDYSCVPASNGYPLQLRQAAAAMHYIKSVAAAHRTIQDRIAAIGFSAGGHLCAALSTQFGAACVAEFGDVRPWTSVLAYPVISVRYPHVGTFQNVATGTGKAANDPFFSLETHVTAQTPPTFLWHTADDNGVDVRNSLVYAEALTAYGVPYELHVYEKGPHGLSLARAVTRCGWDKAAVPEVAVWVEQALAFLDRQARGPCD
ncbi:MAG: alpha/beta hydrolase [Clostridiales bacterium]|jgi:acetyl esterase/lipase|nr:alpha/beta hydrolase [Clostridiales bacterium]